MNYQGVITLEPGKRGGKPCIRGKRIPEADGLGRLASGMTHAEILADFPELREEDICACLAYAADREHKAHLIAAHESSCLTRTCCAEAWLTLRRSPPTRGGLA